MKTKVSPRVLAIYALLAVAGGALAQTPNKHREFRGVINDFTPASTIVPGGPWEVRGPWSLVLREKNGKGDCKADFSAALTMERSDLGVIQNGGGDLNNPKGRMAHTHHITLIEGEITTIPGGFQVTGLATITANGMFPPPFQKYPSDLSTLTIDITGGAGENSVEFSNITLVFGYPADGHFGKQPLHGVVRSSK